MLHSTCILHWCASTEQKPWFWQPVELAVLLSQSLWPTISLGDTSHYLQKESQYSHLYYYGRTTGTVRGPIRKVMVGGLTLSRKALGSAMLFPRPGRNRTECARNRLGKPETRVHPCLVSCMDTISADVI